ncbi:MAG: respiratory nitrate reductase subunit gamma [bacterium]
MPFLQSGRGSNAGRTVHPAIFHQPLQSILFSRLKGRCRFGFAAVAALLLLGQPSRTAASWFLDGEHFLASVHGELSCQDCHEEVSSSKSHPDPADVNRDPRESFSPDRCADCHQDVVDKIDEGRHARVRRKKGRAAWEKCLDCHDPHYQEPYENRRQAEPEPGAGTERSRPRLAEADAACMDCHGSVPAGASRAAEKVAALCMYCHGETRERPPAGPAVRMPLLDGASYAASTHRKTACTVCHLASAAYPHARQRLGPCGTCHARHDEKVAHDPHLGTTCEACHLAAVEPVREAASGSIAWKLNTEAGRPLEVHRMSWRGGLERCRRCHFPQNRLGAAAQALPAKSILCMPCHAATFSASDPVTLAALAIFALGLASLVMVWVRGSSAIGQEGRGGLAVRLPGALEGFLRVVFSRRMGSILRALFLDAFLQRRLYKQSRVRWAIHGLIFFPVVVRFGYGLAGLLASLLSPQWPPTWVLLDKNAPVTALVSDLTGVLVLLGVALVMARRLRSRPEQRLEGLPRPDWAAYGLLFGVLAVGYILEGMRIAMTGSPPGAAYAFVGCPLSHLLGGAGLDVAFGYVWYAHAVLTGAFVAYLPFSRMFHIVMAPVSIALRAAAGKSEER